MPDDNPPGRTNAGLGSFLTLQCSLEREREGEGDRERRRERGGRVEARKGEGKRVEMNGSGGFIGCCQGGEMVDECLPRQDKNST